MKFAQVGYGSDGRSTGDDGKGFTYVVNDNVRTGDTISPVVRHYKSGTLFATTGKIVSTAKTLETKNGQEISEHLDEKEITKDQLTQAYTGKELGIPREMNIGGRSRHDENGDYMASQREKLARAESILKVQETNAIRGGSTEISGGEKTREAFKTYEDYIKAYGGK